MSEVPVQLIVAAFQDERSADQALKVLKEARREKLIGIVDAAVLRKYAQGSFTSKRPPIWVAAKAQPSAVAGAAIGLIAGPVLVVPVAVGALIGGLAAKLSDSGFKNERLRTLGESLKPGSSAIVAVVEHQWVAQVQQAMAEAGRPFNTARSIPKKGRRCRPHAARTTKNATTWP